MKELRVIVAGSRDFNDFVMLVDSCKKILSKVETDAERVRIVSGTARGADQLGEQFAELAHFELSRFPADWDKFGKSAGFIRNVEMTKFAIEDGSQGMIIAFWNGESKGTKHMIDQAEKYGLGVHVVRYQNVVGGK